MKHVSEKLQSVAGKVILALLILSEVCHQKSICIFCAVFYYAVYLVHCYLLACQPSNISQFIKQRIK
jgi:hypothetical protein